MTEMTREEIEDYLSAAKALHRHCGSDETFCLRVNDMEAITRLALEALDARGRWRPISEAPKNNISEF